MSGVASWVSGLLAFLAGFGLASLIGSIIYWGARFKSPALQGVAALVCIAALVMLLITFSQIFKSDDALWMLLAFCVIGGLGALQASIERAIDSSRREWKWHWGRSLLQYAVGISGAGCVLGITLSFVRLGSNLDELVVFLALGGYGVGFLFAPLSISFFRWMIPGSRLRPGIDRAFQEGEDRDDSGSSL